MREGTGSDHGEILKRNAVRIIEMLVVLRKTATKTTLDRIGIDGQVTPSGTIGILPRGYNIEWLLTKTEVRKQLSIWSLTIPAACMKA